MLDVLVLRTALTAFSALFGGLGVFFTYFSFYNHNAGVEAVLFLATALAALWGTEKRK